MKVVHTGLMVVVVGEKRLDVALSFVYILVLVFEVDGFVLGRVFKDGEGYVAPISLYGRGNAGDEWEVWDTTCSLLQVLG